MFKFLDILGRYVVRAIEEIGQVLIMFISASLWTLRPPFRLGAIIKQMEVVGVNSLFVVILTGGSIGAVFTLQVYYGFSRFGAESMVGPTIALAMTRELGPVLTALMVTGRCGSAMAAELGTMRVTEQIDALFVMAANPVKYLVVPRIIAAVIVLPLLTVFADFMGVLGSYVVGVGLLGINSGLFIGKTLDFVDLSDVGNGLIKSAVFGLLLALVGCYKGFFTKGGAEGVGRSTTEAVVEASVLILVADYFMTAIMF